MTDWKDTVRAALIGGFCGVAIGLLAYFLLRHTGMGSVLFVLVPFAVGFSVALVAKRPNVTAAAVLVALLCSLGILIAFGAEGVLCAILALPILAVGLALGVVVGLLARKLVVKHFANSRLTTGFLLLIGPLLLIAGERVERPILTQARTEVVTSAVEVHAPPARVWDQIQTVENVESRKPLLMYFGLPIPQRCTMRGHGLGARRTCYFRNGYIEETITAWNPPRLMGLSIDRTHLPGSRWLGFVTAEYRLTQRGRTTVLTRTTTITSHLIPHGIGEPLKLAA